MNQSTSTLESVEATTTQPEMADSEGDHSLPPSTQQGHVTAVTPSANARVDPARVEVVKDFNRTAPVLTHSKFDSKAN